MATKQEVENFLKEFKGKMKIWDVLFRSDRDSNMQALADLDIRPIEREKVLENLKVTDYSEGPMNYPAASSGVSKYQLQSKSRSKLRGTNP